MPPRKSVVSSPSWLDSDFADSVSGRHVPGYALFSNSVRRLGGTMPDTVHGPWEQEEGSDYDEPKSGGGDSHEDEFDEEYGEQRPHGDPDRPDNALEDAYQADIDYWEAMARLNAIAQPFDRDASFTSDASTHNPFADELEDSSSVSLSSHLSSPDPDDFDDAAIVDPVGPPRHDSAVAEPDVASGLSFDPAVPFADAFGDGSVSPSSELGPPERFDPDESYQAAIVDEPDVASSPSFAPEVEFRPDMPEQTDWNDFIG
jgi:hypothetical protein